jgi:hypothetical protein
MFINFLVPTFKTEVLGKANAMGYRYSREKKKKIIYAQKHLLIVQFWIFSVYFKGPSNPFHIKRVQPLSLTKTLGGSW